MTTATRTGLQHVSLFSGVGGIDLAFERAGVPTVAACEIDKAAAGVLADHWPNLPLFDDVKELTGDDLRALGCDPARTVLSGGFPCQDLSVAGGRRGMGEGTRSGLFWHIDRILGEFAPAWIVLENVPGLLSSVCICPGDERCQDTGRHAKPCGAFIKPKNQPRQWVDNAPHGVKGGSCSGGCISVHGGAMGAVLGALAERGYGYAYRVLDAQFFGVPQRRRRVVIVGHLGDGAGPVEILFEPEGVRGDPSASIAAGPITSQDATGRSRASGVLGDIAHTLMAEGHDASEDGSGRGTPVIAQSLMARDRPVYDPSMETLIVPILEAGARTGISTQDPRAGMGIGEPGDPMFTLQATKQHTVAFHPTQDPINGDVVPPLGATSGGQGISHVSHVPKHASTLTAGTSSPGVSAPGLRQEDDVNLVAYAAQTTNALDTAQGGPDDNTAQAGQLVVTYQKTTRPQTSDDPEIWEERNVAATLPPFDLGSDTRTVELILAPTLTAALGEGGWAGHNRKDEMVERTFEAGTTVRRLTPIECERLQGHPDDWTVTSKGKPQSDSARYKQMGNGVAEPVFEWTARRLVATDAGCAS